MDYSIGMFLAGLVSGADKLHRLIILVATLFYTISARNLGGSPERRQFMGVFTKK